MQAIILAAGMGKRLGEYTKNCTKCMVPVNGVTLIDRLLGQLSKLGLNRIVIVVGYKGKELIDYVGKEYMGLKIEYIKNPIYDRTNNIYSLALAKQHLQEDDSLLIESDLIYDDGIFDLLINNPHPNLALVAKYETWMDGTMVRIDEDNNLVISMEKKTENKEEKKDGRYLRREFSYSKFQQTMILPDNVDKEKIAASVEHGVLNIELPKLSEEEVKKPNRQIEIK